MFWELDEPPKEVVTTWQELSTFHRNWLKTITYSEFDRAEKPTCYTQISIKADSKEAKGPGLDFLPLIFQSIFHVETKKGCGFIYVILTN